VEGYAEALALDPRRTDAALGVLRAAEAARDTARLREALDAVRRAGRGAPGDDSRVLRARGRVERELGHSDSALAVFERYRASAIDTALGLVELARTALADTVAARRAGIAGDSLYYVAAALDDSAAVLALRTDLAPLLDSAALAPFDSARGAARAAWLRRFWTDRDRLDLRRPGERIREHYRRLAVARRDFALTINRRYYAWRDAYRSGSTEFDDRGIVFLRHGEPDTRLRPFVLHAMPNETWRYSRPDGDLLLHFSAGGGGGEGGDLYDYRLVSSVLDLRGDGMVPEDAVLSRQSVSDLYSDLAGRGPYAQARIAKEERAIGSASIAVATTTDSHLLHFGRRIDAAAELLAVSGGGPAAQLVFAIRDSSFARPAPDSARRVRVRLVTMDSSERPVASLDTLVSYRDAGPGNEGWLVGHVAVALGPGVWRWRAGISAGDSAGTLLPTRSVRVPSSAWDLGDIAIGAPGIAARWEAAPGDTVFLTPFSAFRRVPTLELYYELHGAEPRRSYRHEITLSRRRADQREDGHPAVSLGFDETAPAALARIHRGLDLSRLRAGDYVVRVRVTDSSGRAVERRRPFSLRER
jgi:GWxTD domain-containing protein